VIIGYHVAVSLKERHSDAILRAIHEAGRPVSVNEILDILSDTGIGIATVYRAVKKATADGILARVELPNAAARFEPAGLPHHHHFACGTCDKVFGINGCPRGLDALAPDGFVIHGHEIVLRGLCGECADLAT